jgi:hypothetical protein
MYEQRQPDHDDFDFAKVWHGAQCSRADEMRTWLSRSFAGWHRIKSIDFTKTEYHQSKSVA